MNWIIVFFIILIVMIMVQVLANINDIKRRIDFTNTDEIEKLKYINYKYLKIKRKRRPWRRILAGGYTEYSLEAELPVPWFIIPPEDIIEIYGFEENNSKYLLYTTDWSKDNAKKLKKIVDELNIEYEKRHNCT